MGHRGRPRPRTAHTGVPICHSAYSFYSFSGDMRYPCRRPLLELDIVELENYTISFFLDRLKKTRFDSQKQGFRVEGLQKNEKVQFLVQPHFYPTSTPLSLYAAQDCYVSKSCFSPS